MKLREILTAIPDTWRALPETALEIEITGLSTNSHACKPGDLFIGIPGSRVDGGDFWPSALAAGAVAALVSPQAALKQPIEPDTIVIPVANIKAACALAAAKFYGQPAEKMKMVGVTGTNGKTTTTHLIEFILNKVEKQTALFGTLYARWPGFVQTAIHTTPFAVELQQQLAQAVAANCQICVMEVSSHSLAQGRVIGCPFEVAVFTNLTQDHLDYHRDMEDYFAAKALLFTPEYLKGRAIINLDDPYGKRLISQLPPEKVWTYSTSETTADLWASEINYQPTGVKGILHTPTGETAFELPLVGKFNLSNMLAAIGAVLHLGVDLGKIVEILPAFPGVPGRMERVQIQPNQDITVIVDYAHTPDSLENLLKASRPFIRGKMICVFGCGGDRDRSKRPQMGKIAADLADKVVVTSDNPRTENPERILQDILAGIPETKQPIVISERAKAIRTAILQAQPGDGVLIAGKGHETYQILGTEKIHFDDREQAREALKARYSAVA